MSFSLLTAPVFTSAAIVVGTSDIATSTGTSSLTKSITVASGTTLLLVSIGLAGGCACSTGVTYNGSNLTSIASSTTNVDSAMYYMTNPTATTANVVASFSSAFDRATVMTITQLSGTATSPIGTTGTASGTGNTMSKAITTVADNSYIFDSVSERNNHTFTVGGSQTQITNQSQSGTLVNGTDGVSYQTTTTAGSHTMSWTSDNGADGWDIVAVEIKASLATPISLFGFFTSFWW